MKLEGASWFPSGEQLCKILAIEDIRDLDDLFSDTLHKPLNEFISRPRKGIRSQLVQLGYLIGQRYSMADAVPVEALELGCEVLELIHTGSLIVDDIEDGSLERRGGPTVHTIYGTPIALNAGNWLYFLPFEHIKRMPISEVSRNNLIAEYHQMLLRAHYGQALDVGVCAKSLDQKRVPEVTRASLELKSGVLVGFALKMGGIIATAPDCICSRMETFGRKLGLSLQMFDDIGNVAVVTNSNKHCEDLKLQRLSFVTAIVAKTLSPSNYQKYFELIDNLPLTQEDLLAFMSKHQILNRSRQEAQSYLSQIVAEVSHDLELTDHESSTLNKIRESLEICYG